MAVWTVEEYRDWLIEFQETQLKVMKLQDAFDKIDLDLKSETNKLKSLMLKYKYQISEEL